jgi:hypothetical protein
MRSDSGMERIPEDQDSVVKRLRSERPEASALELDRIKLKAVAWPSRSAPALTSRIGIGRGPRKGLLIASSRLVSVAVTVSLIGGSGAVLAASGGGPFKSNSSSSNSAGSSQYCPDQAAGPPKEKNNDPPGNKCGQPNVKNP